MMMAMKGVGSALGLRRLWISWSVLYRISFSLLACAFFYFCFDQFFLVRLLDLMASCPGYVVHPLAWHHACIDIG